MNYQPLTITQISGGLERDSESILIPADAFPVIENMYVWRDRVRTREHAELLGRLQRDLTAESIGNSGASPWAFNLFTLLGLLVAEPNASIEVGSVEIVVGAITFTDNGDGTLTGDVALNTGVINYMTGAVTLTHTAGAGVASTVSMTYFPNLPVMGLFQWFEEPFAEERTIAFDTIYSYILDTGSGLFEEWIPGYTWQGDNLNFFWCSNIALPDGSNTFWATNFNNAAGIPDPIRWTDGGMWNTSQPNLDGGTNFVFQCLAVVAWKNHVLMFNTWEGTTAGTAIQYPQRVRWSQYNTDPTVDANWNETTNLGGSLDASTAEHLVSVSVIRDTIIVSFEQSTWALRYLGEQTVPFVWERIDSEFGSLAPFSHILFDRGVFTVGTRGITTTDGNNVTRIDTKIPDEILSVAATNGGRRRTYGIRDFSRQIALWTYVSIFDSVNATSPVYPTRMITYNYVNDTWAIWTESHTCLGYHRRITDERWIDLPDKFWDTYWVRWVDGREVSTFPFVIGGNQQGFVMIHASAAQEGPHLYIQAISTTTPLVITSPAHQLLDGQIVRFSDILGNAAALALNDTAYQVTVVTTDTFSISEWDGSAYQPVSGSGVVYYGDGKIAKIYNFSLRSKNFNLLDIGASSLLGFIDFLIECTANGEISCNVYADWARSTPINTGSDQFFNQVIPTSPNDGAIEGVNADEHRFYCPLAAKFFQFRLYLDDDQINDLTIAELPVVIHSITIWATKAGRLVR